LITFFVVWLAPGTPVDMMITPDMSEEAADMLRRAYGFDAPWYAQYFRWVSDLFRGNLGWSFSAYRPVAGLIADRIQNTFLLMGASLLMGILISVPLGILSAARQNSILDRTLAFASYCGISVPNFFMGLAMIYLFSVKLKWLPSGSLTSFGDVNSIVDTFVHMIMPGSVLIMNTTCRFTRYIRAFMLEALHQDFLRTAAAKGVPAARRMYAHAFRYAMLPFITLIGLEIPVLFGGSVVVERIFAWPGIGSLAMDAMLNRDYPVIMGVNLITAILVLLSGLAVDFLYFFADPRVKFR
jgi:peptide/nickel transport system permease protein